MSDYHQLSDRSNKAVHRLIEEFQRHGLPVAALDGSRFQQEILRGYLLADILVELKAIRGLLEVKGSDS